MAHFNSERVLYSYLFNSVILQNTVNSLKKEIFGEMVAMLLFLDLHSGLYVAAAVKELVNSHKIHKALF